MKIALYQMHMKWEDKEANYLKLENELLKNSGKNIRLFLLPEMSFTGFSMNTAITKECDNQTVKRISDYAKKFKVAIGFGWVKDCGEKSENYYSIVDSNGNILSQYAKIHPFSYSGENKKFRGGNWISNFCYGGIHFSTFICYDLRFPEIFQIASKKADVIIVPANWPDSRVEHWKCLLRARAIENQVYIVGINCVGKINKLGYSGYSCIIDPNGIILKEISNEEGILEYDLENNVQMIRNGFPVKNDRREELYNKLKNEGNDLCT